MPVYGRLVVNAVVVLGIACCAAAVPRREATSNMKALTIEDNDRVIDLVVGEIFTLTLESIPGAGFSWTVVEKARGHVTTLGEPEPVPCPEEEPAGERVGAPSCQMFRFEAAKAGVGSLKLHYARAWEKGTPPEKTFTVELRIQ